MRPSDAGHRVEATVAGIVLAAGRSRRMGRPKPLLEAAGGEPFIERAVRVLRQGGCTCVLAVLPRTADRAVHLADVAGALVVLNPAPDSEQVDSLRLALEHVPGDVAAAVVLPVDHPLVRPATVAALIEAFSADGAPAVRPVHRGRPGHPTLFSLPVLRDRLTGPLPHGARTIIDALGAAVHDRPVDDPGIIADVDTPGDYRHFVEGNST